jgi:hypothetical protein
MSETEPSRPPPDTIPPETPAASERHTPMLDVHTIHAPVHGWRDFFIHIATIVVGLCIAVGIQQTVEFVHNRHQRAELRQALRLERQENYKALTNETKFWRWGTAELQNNLMIFQYLQQHPGTPQEKLPGVLQWWISSDQFISVVWDAARQSGAVALLPREEIETVSSMYFYVDKMNQQTFQAVRALLAAERYDLSDSDPSHLTPAQVAAEIELTQTALTEQYIRGSLLRNLVENCPDFPATVTREELHRVRHEPDAQTQELLAPARALTMERLKAAGYVE